MQSRRDQLQAYRFLVRRAVAAVVTGEPDVPESPMRRLTITTLSGIMIAILVAAGFGIFGIIRPGPSEKWKAEGAIVVDPNGTRYVYVKGTLYPTKNYASAVLAALPATPEVVQVSRKAIQNVPRGQSVGIDGLPDSLPSDAKGLTTGPWAVCSTLSSTDTGSSLSVTLFGGRDTDTTAVPQDRALYVQTTDAARYLLYRGRSYAVDKDSAAAVGLSGVAPVYVGKALLAGIPADPAPIAPIRVEGYGEQSRASVDGKALAVGDLVDVGEDHYVITRAGVTAVSDFLYVLLKQTHPSVVRSSSVPQGPTAGVFPTTLPDALPATAEGANRSTRVCDTYDAGSKKWTLSNAVGDDAISQAVPDGGTTALVDTVKLRGDDGAALVTYSGSGSGSADGTAAVSLLAQTGQKYQVTSTDVLKSFHYDGAKTIELPFSVLRVVPAGPALDASRIRQRESN